MSSASAWARTLRRRLLHRRARRDHRRGSLEVQHDRSTGRARGRELERSPARGAVWRRRLDAGSYDPKLHLVYFGTGNTYDTATLLEPPTARPVKAGLYTDTTLALDVRSGKLVWHFQHVNRDVWDLDWVFERSLLTLPIDGVPKDVLVTGGKIAMFDALDRGDGPVSFLRRRRRSRIWSREWIR